VDFVTHLSFGESLHAFDAIVNLLVFHIAVAEDERGWAEALVD